VQTFGYALLFPQPSRLVAAHTGDWHVRSQSARDETYVVQYDPQIALSVGLGHPVAADFELAHSANVIHRPGGIRIAGRVGGIARTADGDKFY